jgi:outer membrane protein assembly factor BamB
MNKIKAFLFLFFMAACTSLPKQPTPSRFGELGAIEIEKSPRLNRGAPVGSYIPPVMLNTTDFLVGTLGGSFGRLDSTTGSFKWKKTFKVGVASRPVVKGNHVFVGAMNGFVYCYNLQDGKEIWKRKLSAETMGNLLMGAEFLYAATADNVLWALNTVTGQEQWTLRRPSPNAAYYWSLRGNTAGVLSPDKKTIYLGFSDGIFLALKAQTGETIWERSFSRPGRFQDADVEPVLSPDDKTLVITLPDHSIQILNATNGSSIDNFADASGFQPWVDFSAGTLIYSTLNGSLRKYNFRTKRMLWELDLEKRGLGAEFTPLKGNELLFSSTRYGLHILDQEKGRIVDEKYLGAGIVSKPYTDGQRVLLMTGRSRLLFLKLL